MSRAALLAQRGFKVLGSKVWGSDVHKQLPELERSVQVQDIGNTRCRFRT
jgi:hypothetical protein